MQEDYLDKPNKAGNTALHKAAYYGHVAVVQYLLELGAKDNVENLHRQTPLGAAIEHGNGGVVVALINHRIKSNQLTPFQFVVLLELEVFDRLQIMAGSICSIANCPLQHFLYWHLQEAFEDRNCLLDGYKHRFRELLIAFKAQVLPETSFGVEFEKVLLKSLLQEDSELLQALSIHAPAPFADCVKFVSILFTAPRVETLTPVAQVERIVECHPLNEEVRQEIAEEAQARREFPLGTSKSSIFVNF